MHDGTMNVLGIVLIDCVYFGIVLAAVSREKSATQIQTEMQLHAYGIRDTYDRVYIYNIYNNIYNIYNNNIYIYI